MKKVLPVLIVVLLVLGCCLTAGCTASSTDPILGSWTATDTEDNQSVTITETFNADGTGTAVAVFSDGSTTTNRFDWFNMGSVYQFIYDDGTTASTTYDAEKDVLKVPSGLIFTRQ